MQNIPVFTVRATQDGEEVKVSTEFHQYTSGVESIDTLALVVRGMIETMVKLGGMLGMSQDDVLARLDR